MGLLFFDPDDYLREIANNAGLPIETREQANIVQQVKSLTKEGSTQSAEAKLVGELSLAAQSLEVVAANTKAEIAMLELAKAKLETEISGLERQLQERHRYELCYPEPGMPFYILKKEESRGEPLHFACSLCFARGHIRVPCRTNKRELRSIVYVCPECGTDYAMSKPLDAESYVKSLT